MNKPSDLKPFIFSQRSDMGAAAADYFHAQVERLVTKQGHCRIVVGCAPSQDEFFANLRTLAEGAPEIWTRVELFHMDEYVGLPERDPESFRSYLRRSFLDHVAVARFHLIEGDAPSAEAEATRYAMLLSEAPIDLIAMGIGENGHVAFNDPPVADFNDPLLAKVVEIDEGCRRQQVNDGCFPTVGDVPRLAITITLPVFASASCLVCIVPGERKATAVCSALNDEIGTACPATIMRTHPHVRLFIDSSAASLLPDQ